MRVQGGLTFGYFGGRGRCSEYVWSIRLLTELQMRDQLSRLSLFFVQRARIGGFNFNPQLYTTKLCGVRVCKSTPQPVSMGVENIHIVLVPSW